MQQELSRKKMLYNVIIAKENLVIQKQLEKKTSPSM
jgi:hypothetical protein